MILFAFSSISFIGGGAGYLWASKELEVAKAKESTAVILKQQVTAIRQSHAKAMLPLQSALDDAAQKLSDSVLGSTRQDHLKEINQINSVIQERESQLAKTISGLTGVFNQMDQ